METVQYKCPCCGASLEFNSADGNFSCGYCGSSFTMEQLKAAFPDNESMELKDNVDEAAEKEFCGCTALYSCPNCGAEIIGEDNTTAATMCYYCHTPVILSGRLSGEYKPSKVIPFKFSKEQADDIYKNWCKKRILIPTEFTTSAQLEKLAGVYLPFWLADCKLDMNVHAIGKHIRTWRSGDYEYTETKEYAVERRGYVDFRGIPADGSQKTEDALMEAIEPFDYNEMKPFSMAYLSGYLAEKYDVGKAEILPRISNRAKSGGLEIAKHDMHYDSVENVADYSQLIRTDWTYSLLPVWLMYYTYKGKRYSFSVNGQTGKFAGTPPVSIPKLLALLGGIFGGALLVMLILGGIVGV